MAHSLNLEANASLMCNNILGSVSYATLANCPIKRTLENEREIATLPKLMTASYINGIFRSRTSQQFYSEDHQNSSLNNVASILEVLK